MPLANTASSTAPTLLWNFTANQDTVFSPVVANGLVYATSENKFGSPVTLFCINASIGTQVWNTTGTSLNFAVANGYIYVTQAIEAQSSAALPISQGAISCLNAYNGDEIWNCSYSTQLGTPVVDGSIVYVEGTNFTLALNASTGAEIWNFAAPTETHFSELVLAGPNLYAVSVLSSTENGSINSAVYALDASSGKELWNYTAPGQFSSVVTDGQNVYVSSNFEDTRGQFNYENRRKRVSRRSSRPRCFKWLKNLGLPHQQHRWITHRC